MDYVLCRRTAVLLGQHTQTCVLWGVMTRDLEGLDHRAIQVPKPTTAHSCVNTNPGLYVVNQDIPHGQAIPDQLLDGLPSKSAIVPSSALSCRTIVTRPARRSPATSWLYTHPLPPSCAAGPAVKSW